MTNTAKQELIETPKYAVAEYNEFDRQMQEMREHNKSAKFNYADPKDNKAARSHIFKLRQTKAAIDKVRLKAGEEARERIKTINSQGQALIAEVEGMIDHHQKHIEEIEQKEAKRISEIKDRISDIKGFLNPVPNANIHLLREMLSILEKTTVDTTFAEFMAEATKAQEESLSFLRGRIADMEAAEAREAELARLRAEAAEREKRDHEERIAREAEEKARKDAEAKAAAEKLASERREQTLKELAEKAERERLAAIERAAQEKERAERAAWDAEQRRQRELKEAEERAERLKQEAIERERCQIEEERLAKEEADKEREDNLNNQKKIHNAIVSAFGEVGIPEDTAKQIIVNIRKGAIPHIKIEY